MRLDIENWRWAGVPFLIRAGKRLPVTATEVLVRLRPPPQRVFSGFAFSEGAPNHFRFRLGPEVEIALAAQIRANGDVPAGVGETVELYACRDRRGMIDAYERLLCDAMEGDALLFARQDEVENAWQVVDPALKAPPTLQPYEPGSWGPAAAERSGRGDRRLARAGRAALRMTALVRGRDAEEVARAAAGALTELARAAQAERGVFTLALAGGDTPRRLYAQLAADGGVDWERAELFFGDERPVPPEHPESNYGMARATLLAPLGIAAQRVHRIEAERRDLDAVAREYEALLVRLLGGGPAGPQLDLVLLGMGADGHTGSLFPHSAALAERRRWVVANDVPQLATRRITLTFPLIERARRVWVLVCGESKADALAQVLEGPWDPERLPSQRLRDGAHVEWRVDAAAAGRLGGAGLR